MSCVAWGSMGWAFVLPVSAPALYSAADQNKTTEADDLFPQKARWDFFRLAEEPLMTDGIITRM